MSKCYRAKQADLERIAAVEQAADQQIVEAAMRRDAQEEAADKQLKAERKAAELKYRSGCYLLACTTSLMSAAGYAFMRHRDLC